MGAVSEQPDNEHGVQAGTPTQDFLAYTTKKKRENCQSLPPAQLRMKLLYVPQKKEHVE